MSELLINSRFTTKNLKITVVRLILHCSCRQIFTRLEPNGFPGRDGHFGAGSRVTANAAFTGLNYKNAKAAKLDPFSEGKSVFHCVEQ